MINTKQIKIHENALLKAKNYKRAEAELLQAIEEAERERIYLLFERNSLFQYCIKDLELTEDVAQNFICVMRKGKVVPEIKEAILNEELSISKARRIVPILNENNQDYWIKEAKNNNLSELQEKLAAAFPERVKKETIRSINEEYVSITVRIKKEDFEEIKKARTLCSKKSKRSVSMEETLVQTAKEFIKKYDPFEKAQRAKERSDKKPNENNAKEPKVANKNGPDKKKNSEVKSNSNDLSGLVQVKTHHPNKSNIPAKNLHDVNLRDQGKCQYRDKNGEICKSTSFIEVHHIVPRSKGGTNEVTNLISVCK